MNVEDRGQFLKDALDASRALGRILDRSYTVHFRVPTNDKLVRDGCLNALAMLSCAIAELDPLEHP
jgi:hypothetical protein